MFGFWNKNLKQRKPKPNLLSTKTLQRSTWCSAKLLAHVFKLLQQTSTILIVSKIYGACI